MLVRGNRIWHVVLDAGVVAGSYWLAYYIRFDTGTPAFYQQAMLKTIGFVVAIKLGVFIATGMYDKWWRYLSIKDMEGVVRSTLFGSGAALLYLYLNPPLTFVRIPRSVAVLDFVLTLFGIAILRLAARSFFDRPNLRTRRLAAEAGTRVLVVGAGEAGRLLIREMQRQPLGMVPAGIVDDDDRKQHMKLDGVSVFGTTSDIATMVEEHAVEEVLIAIPSAPGETIQRIVATCRDLEIPVRILPSINELVLGDRSSLARQLRTVQVEDVLGREPVEVDLESIARYLTDQVVLVTGAGGSIGSELCRQIANMLPQLLVLVDHAEPSIFAIEQELLTERDFDAIVPMIADVTDEVRMRTIFERFEPTVVFHAAAYKHVPMLEQNPEEAIRNNSLGTRTMCRLAEEAGVERFVLVSTDKAVAPRNVMGQSKALAEWVVQAHAERSVSTRFMAVRFGNVLGSAGSVIPIFRRQIERGGPVRITDPRMTRFFMTIPEAAQLIIQAGAMGSGGEVFVLDMGTPVRIIDLARNMIELSGMRPDVDIAIEVVGPRPGEKMHEELWAGDEAPERTSHPKIWRSDCSFHLSNEELMSFLDDMRDRISGGTTPAEVSSMLLELMAPRIEAGARSMPFAEPATDQS